MINSGTQKYGVFWRLTHMNFSLPLLLLALGAIGVITLYSAAGGHWHPWAMAHAIRLLVGFFVMVVVAQFSLRFWQDIAYPLYAVVFLLLVYVELKGHIGMGAQRWISLGPIKLQPSEVMKVTLILALARYYARRPVQALRGIKPLIVPLAFILLPTALVLKQPDLGTALMLCMVGGAVMFLAGTPLWVFGLAAAVVGSTVPLVWPFLHDYQKRRVLTFLNPESDPLGAGYHVMQSKIALGSGGINGKGFLQGTQGHLDFLPEKQTDFIFTFWAEEFGFIGGLIVLALCGFLFLVGGMLAVQARQRFAQLLIFGITINMSLYVLINIGMVMGLLPVVGVPLPLVSYGGTVILSMMFGYGLVQSAHLSRLKS